MSNSIFRRIASSVPAAFIHDRRGTIAIVFALALPVVAASLGVAIDFGRAAQARSQMQSALDAAVVSAASGSARDAQRALAAKFKANLRGTGIENIALSLQVEASGQVVASAKGSVVTTFARLMNISTLDVGVVSEAGIGGGGTTTTTTTTTIPGGQVCVLLLDPNSPQSLLVNSGASIKASNCDIDVNSKGNPAAIFNAGSTVVSAGICIAGTTIIDNGGTHPNLATGCTTVADPFAGSMPTPASGSCTYSNMNYNGGTVNLSPGVYCGWTNFNSAPTVNLAPGVYVVKGGGWNVDGGTWTGAGVTFYFADTSHIQFNSGISSTLSAPTTGVYSGILMFEASGLARSPFVWDDAVSSNLDGLIYLPSRDATFNSYSKAVGEPLTMVFNTLIVDRTDWDIQSASLAINKSATTTTSTTTTTTPGSLTLEK